MDLDDGCGCRNERRAVGMFGTVAVLTAGLARSMHVLALKMDWWKTAVTPLQYAHVVPTESAPDRCVTQTRYCGLDEASNIRY